MSGEILSFWASKDIKKEIRELVKTSKGKSASEVLRELVEGAIADKKIEKRLDKADKKIEYLVREQQLNKRNTVRMNLALNLLAEILLKDEKTYMTFLQQVKEKEQAIWGSKED